MRMRSPWMSMALTMADMMIGKASGLPVALLSDAGLRTMAPSLVAIDQLLCLPEPFTVVVGGVARWGGEVGWGGGVRWGGGKAVEVSGRD